MSFLEYADKNECSSISVCGSTRREVQRGKLRSINRQIRSQGSRRASEEWPWQAPSAASLRRFAYRMGIKQAGKEISWELYFYDYAKYRARALYPADSSRPSVSLGFMRYRNQRMPAVFHVLHRSFPRVARRTGGVAGDSDVYRTSSWSSGICYGVTTDNTYRKISTSFSTPAGT